VIQEGNLNILGIGTIVHCEGEKKGSYEGVFNFDWLLT
jgi:hypothetical protein